jgi:hypothetical protein
MELTSDASDVDRESFFGANAARTYAGVIAG